jgi:hypothetical protein
MLKKADKKYFEQYQRRLVNSIVYTKLIKKNFEREKNN